jgi:hypothetical protein
MNKIALVVSFLILFVFGTVLAADSTSAKGPDWNQVYDSLVQRVKKADSSVDFLDLRMAFAKSSLYNPYGDPGHGWRDSMLAARQREDIPSLLKYTTGVLDSNFVDIDAHLLLAFAYNRQNDTLKYQFERWVAKSLMKSIFSTGNGKNLERAYQVISVDEERSLITFTGLRILQQSVTTDNGHHYDKFDLENPSDGQKFTLYFNIDIQMDWMQHRAKLPKAG